MPHVTYDRIKGRYEGDAQDILIALFIVGAEGLDVGKLAEIVCGGEPSGAFERTLIDLYRDGVCSPPAALWATDEGVAACR